MSSFSNKSLPGQVQISETNKTLWQNIGCVHGSCKGPDDCICNPGELHVES